MSKVAASSGRWCLPLFGTGVASDAYTNVHGEHLFFAVFRLHFVHLYSHLHKTCGKRKRCANAYTNSILTLFSSSAWSSACWAILRIKCASCSCVIPSAAPGTELFAQQMEKLNMTADMARVMFPTMSFAACTGVFTALLNANERFVPEQLMGFVLSGTVISACVFFSEYGIYAVAVATAATYLLQLLIILPFLKGIYRFHPSLAPLGGRVKQTFMLALPAIMSMALDELNHLVDKTWASGWRRPEHRADLCLPPDYADSGRSGGTHHHGDVLQAQPVRGGGRTSAFWTPPSGAWRCWRWNGAADHRARRCSRRT